MTMPLSSSQKTAQVDSAKIWTKEEISSLWGIVAPLWPLKNLIAVNPLQGFEDLPFETALEEARAFFQHADYPFQVEALNRESIKWLKAFLDEGQAAIRMPLRHLGFYRAWKKMAPWDKKLHGNDPAKKEWIGQLPATPEETISLALSDLAVAPEEQELFLRLMLTTLPGWAAYVKYRNEWNPDEQKHPYPISPSDYLAVRVATIRLLWPEAKELLSLFEAKKGALAKTPTALAEIEQQEKEIHALLLGKINRERSRLAEESLQKNSTGEGSVGRGKAVRAQSVYCIDVRSEPFRRALESTGGHETFGFAGFFGVPIQVEEMVGEKSYPSCPVLLQPAHRVVEKGCCSSSECEKHAKGYEFLMFLKRCYQAVKYNFTTPFPLVETLGPINGVWMMLRTFIPHITGGFSKKLSHAIRTPVPIDVDLSDIPTENQIGYAEKGLRMMGLTKNFAPLVLFIGHGSTTQNNAYATALDCGACGGRHGANNARVLATILNTPAVRSALAERGLKIPEVTFFMAGEHNTTTDEVVLFGHHFPSSRQQELMEIKKDFEIARKINTAWRCGQMDHSVTTHGSVTQALSRSEDWAQARPEWGLSRNSIFLIAPRALSKGADLEGRSFLHSYDWEQDPEATSLEVILTAPMIVTQWINAQYLFSSLDNIAYGGGSKITKNVVGKIGVMQGNSSDLMYGMPLQSLYKNDKERYHYPARLMPIVAAPRKRIKGLIEKHAILQKLFGNGWVKLVCLEPEDGGTYLLTREFGWKKLEEKSIDELSY